MAAIHHLGRCFDLVLKGEGRRWVYTTNLFSDRDDENILPTTLYVS
jgi:hypothetical protein